MTHLFTFAFLLRSKASQDVTIIDSTSLQWSHSKKMWTVFSDGSVWIPSLLSITTLFMAFALL